MIKDNFVVTEKKKTGCEPSSDILNGAACELKNTRPFEGFIYLKKEWVDHDDGIEKVEFQMTTGPINLPANWLKTQSFIMMPEWGTTPLKRTWIVRLPTYLGNNNKYLFHYFYKVTYKDGNENATDTFTQLIMPKEVEYIDHSGECTHVKIHWSTNNWAYPQDSELEVTGIDWRDDFSVSKAPYRAGDPLYENGRAHKIGKISVPRIFKGIIWAPKGETVDYCFQLIMKNENRTTIRWNNNFGKNFKLQI